MNNNNNMEHKGFMLKKGGFIKNWKRRFFHLQKATLSYYAECDQQQQGINLKGTVDLSKAYSVQASDSMPNLFQVLTPDRIWEFRTDTDQDRVAWIKQLNTVISMVSSRAQLVQENLFNTNSALLGNMNVPSNSGSSSSSNSSNTSNTSSSSSSSNSGNSHSAETSFSVTATLISRVQDWMIQREYNTFGASWQRRYMVVTEDTLYVFDTSDQAQAFRTMVAALNNGDALPTMAQKLIISSISLKGCTMEKVGVYEGRTFVFTINTSASNSVVHHIVATDEEEADLWISHLNDAAGAISPIPVGQAKTILKL